MSFLILGFLLLCNGTPYAAVQYPKTPLPDRPQTPAPPHAVVLDCASAVPVTVMPGDSLAFTGDTTGGTSQVSRYGCNAWNESGPEDLYAVTVTEEIRLRVRVTSAAELDVILLSQCDSDSCVAAHISEFDAELSPGTWYVAVDGYAGAAGPYTLTLEARQGGLPQAACDGAVAITGWEAVGGNLLDRPNLMDSYACASYIEDGGEAWYLLTVPPMTELTATVTGQAFDAALWLFESCGDDPVCVDFADAELSGQDESFLIVNDLDTPWELVLGVDSFHPILSSQGDNEFDGAFELNFDVAVPAETTSAGDLKRMFR